MSKHAQRQRGDTKHQAAAKQGPAGLVLHYYAEPGHSLDPLPDPAGPRDLGHYLGSFVEAVDVWAKNAWEQLGDAQRRGHFWIYPATSYAQYLLPQKVRHEAERIVPQLLRSVLAAAPHDVSGNCGDDDGEFRVRVVFRPLSAESIPVQHAELVMLRPAVPLLQRLIGDADAGPEAKLALEALAHFIPEAADALTIANELETGHGGRQALIEPVPQEEPLPSPEEIKDKIKAMLAAQSGDPGQQMEVIASIFTAVREQAAEAMQGTIRVLLKDAQHLDYGGRADLCRRINRVLNDTHMALLDPETGLPATLHLMSGGGAASAAGYILLHDTRPAADGKRHTLRILLSSDPNEGQLRAPRGPRIVADNLTLISTDEGPAPHRQSQPGGGRRR
jgi:hypothetical protein